MKLSRSCNTEAKLKIIKPKSVIKNANMEGTVPPLLRKAPMFLLSKNPYSRIVNAKSCLGRIMLKNKTDTHLKCYRINRGDNTTIMPIAVKKLITHSSKIAEPKEKHMESNESQTDPSLFSAYQNQANPKHSGQDSEDSRTVLKKIYTPDL